MDEELVGNAVLHPDKSTGVCNATCECAREDAQTSEKPRSEEYTLRLRMIMLGGRDAYEQKAQHHTGES